MITLDRPIWKLPSPFLYKKRNADGSSFNIITQLFGENLAEFYAQLGLKGHNGLDFVGDHVDIFAAHDGEVFKTLDAANSSPTAGYGVYIRHKEGWWTLYFHLASVTVKVGQIVKAGELIGVSDNTGQYTKGPHLHFALYPAERDRANGYDGAIDPLPFFKEFIKPENMIVDKKKLVQITNELLLRDPGLMEEKYIGVTEDLTREEIGESEERHKIIKIINTIKLNQF